MAHALDIRVSDLTKGTANCDLCETIFVATHLLLNLGIQVGSPGLRFLRIRREPIQTPLLSLEGLPGALHRVPLRLEIQR